MPCIFHADDGGVQSGGEFAALFGSDNGIVAAHNADGVQRGGTDGRQIQPRLFHIIIDGITFDFRQLRQFGDKAGHQNQTANFGREHLRQIMQQRDAAQAVRDIQIIGLRRADVPCKRVLPVEEHRGGGIGQCGGVHGKTVLLQAA